jgi:hypothetical protein
VVKLKGRWGFGIAETCIALLLLAVGIFPLMDLFSGEERSSVLAGQKLLVNLYLHELVDRVAVASLNSGFARKSFTDQTPRHQVGNEAAGMEVEEVVTMGPVASTAGLYRVEAKVRWWLAKPVTSGASEVGERIATLVTFLADPAPAGGITTEPTPAAASTPAEDSDEQGDA